MWNELIAHHGANEVVSSTAHFILILSKVKLELSGAFGGLTIALGEIKITA